MASYVLYEAAAGYGLFEVSGIDQVELLSPKYQDSLKDFDRFLSVCKLKSFYNFATPEIALENQNDISEGILNNHLLEFLKAHVKPKDTLAVSDTTLYNSMDKVVPCKLKKDSFSLEILRGIRFHFASYLKAYLSEVQADLDSENYVFKAQRGLAHSYSRAKVKFNVNKSDNMIIQSISTLDHLDKDINTFAMRVREWYSWHFPELIKIVNDNILYARVVRLVGNRVGVNDKFYEGILKIVNDEDKARLVIRAGQSSAGYEISEYDMRLIQKYLHCLLGLLTVRFAERVVKLAELRAHLSAYLKAKMLVVAPNLYTLIGETVGARLINKAGSLTNLAKYPSSTVQILGAEKALFRALKNRSNTPKYGLIYFSGYIGRAKAKDKGRISRYIANKCSIASRIDAFSDNATTRYGECLALQVEERLRFLENGGPTPEKNIDVMKKVLATLKDAGAESQPKTPGKSRHDDEMEVEKSGSSKKKDKKDKKKRTSKS